MHTTVATRRVADRLREAAKLVTRFGFEDSEISGITVWGFDGEIKLQVDLTAFHRAVDGGYSTNTHDYHGERRRHYVAKRGGYEIVAVETLEHEGADQ